MARKRSITSQLYGAGPRLEQSPCREQGSGRVREANRSPEGLRQGNGRDTQAAQDVRTEQVSDHSPSAIASNLRTALALLETMPKRDNLEQVIRQSDQSAEDLLFSTIELAHLLVGLCRECTRCDTGGDACDARRQVRQADGRGLLVDRGLIGELRLEPANLGVDDIEGDRLDP